MITTRRNPINRRREPRPKANWTKAFPKQLASLSSQMKSASSQRPKPRRSRIAPVSKRNRGRRAEYKRRARQFILRQAATNPVCPVALAILKRKLLIEDVHHMRGRNGSLLLDERFWLAVSRAGHDWIHTNLAEADRLGFIDLQNWNKPCEQN